MYTFLYKPIICKVAKLRTSQIVLFFIHIIAPNCLYYMEYCIVLNLAILMNN